MQTEMDKISMANSLHNALYALIRGYNSRQLGVVVGLLRCLSCVCPLLGSPAGLDSEGRCAKRNFKPTTKHKAVT